MTSPADLEVAAYILRREGRLDDGAYSPEIALEREHQLDGPDKWAIRGGGNCMDKTGRWSYERQPSSRTDKWLDSHRFGTVEEALLVWTYSAEGSRRVVEGRP